MCAFAFADARFRFKGNKINTFHWSILFLMCRKVAEVLIEHKQWITLMRNRTKIGSTILSPMRQLIIKLPGLSFFVLLIMNIFNISFYY